MIEREIIRVTGSRDRILAAARRLFAEDGVGAVSNRAVVRASGVNVASVHYHFRSKEGLVRAVFQRASERLNAERRVDLERALARCQASSLPVRDILHALYWAPFRRRKTDEREEAKQEYSILAQLRLDPSPMAERILEEHESGVRSLFDEQFANSLPTLASRELRRRIVFTNAAAWDLMGQPHMLDYMCGPNGRSPTLKQVFDSFLYFAVAGMTRGTDQEARGSATSRSKSPRTKTRRDSARSRRAVRPAARLRSPILSGRDI